MTREGYERFQLELKTLRSVERPNVIRAIAEAREHGDLSENAEYHAARERQSFIEGRIADLEGQLTRADIIDPTGMSGDTVKFGAYVTVAENDDEIEQIYQIVGELEADIESGKLALTAPLARALIAKQIGDVVEVQTPSGQREYEILNIEYK